MFSKALLVFGLLMSGSVAMAAPEAWQIAESNTAQWNEALAQGRVEEVVSLYSKDALVLRPDGSVAKRPDEIRAFWRDLKGQMGNLHMTVTEVRNDQEDTIVATTQVSDKVGGGAAAMEYRFGGVLYQVLKRQPDGTWKAQVQKWQAKAI